MSIENVSIRSKEELEKMVTGEMDQIEKGLSVVCSHVPIDDQTNLDILCHDDKGQLVVVQMNTEDDDKILFQGIQSLDYVEKFKSFLKATYNKHKINEEERPRLILVAPSFSETLHHTVEHLEGIHIDLYEWEYLKIGDHKGLRLQPIFPGKTHKWSRKTTEKPEKPEKQPKIEDKKAEQEEKKEKPQPEQTKKEPREFPKPIIRPEEKKEEPVAKREEKPPKRKLKLF